MKNDYIDFTLKRLWVASPYDEEISNTMDGRGELSHTNIRLRPALREVIERMVQNGEAATMSAFIQIAVEKEIYEYLESTKKQIETFKEYPEVYGATGIDIDLAKENVFAEMEKARENRKRNKPAKK